MPLNHLSITLFGQTHTKVRCSIAFAVGPGTIVQDRYKFSKSVWIERSFMIFHLHYFTQGKVFLEHSGACPQSCCRQRYTQQVPR